MLKGVGWNGVAIEPVQVQEVLMSVRLLLGDRFT
jgi:hypothetical protein